MDLFASNFAPEKPIVRHFTNTHAFSEIPLSQVDSISTLIQTSVSINERPQRSLLRAQDLAHLNDSDAYLALANSGCFRSAGINPQSSDI
jgi:hypothetical protein